MKRTDVVLTRQTKENFIPLKQVGYGDYFLFDGHLMQLVEVDQDGEAGIGYYDVNDHFVYLATEDNFACPDDHKVEVLPTVKIIY